jgi:hypothetical protein
MGLQAIYRRPNTSKPAPDHQVYPYLLKGLEINRVNQVWSADITYLPMARGVLYPSAALRAGSGGHHGLAPTGRGWPGGYPTPWRQAYVWRPWKKP